MTEVQTASSKYTQVGLGRDGSRLAGLGRAGLGRLGQVWSGWARSGQVLCTVRLRYDFGLQGSWQPSLVSSSIRRVDPSRDWCRNRAKTLINLRGRMRRRAQGNPPGASVQERMPRTWQRAADWRGRVRLMLAVMARVGSGQGQLQGSGRRVVGGGRWSAGDHDTAPGRLSRHPSKCHLVVGRNRLMRRL